jgi:hypothetical protein
MEQDPRDIHSAGFGEWVKAQPISENPTQSGHKMTELTFFYDGTLPSCNAPASHEVVELKPMRGFKGVGAGMNVFSEL